MFVLDFCDAGISYDKLGFVDAAIADFTKVIGTHSIMFVLTGILNPNKCVAGP